MRCHRRVDADLHDVHAEQDRLEILDGGRHELGTEVADVALTDAGVRPVGVNLDQRRAAQAARAQDVRIAGARTGQQDGLDVGDLHGSQILGLERQAHLEAKLPQPLFVDRRQGTHGRAAGAAVHAEQLQSQLLDVSLAGMRLPDVADDFVVGQQDAAHLGLRLVPRACFQQPPNLDAPFRPEQSRMQVDAAASHHLIVDRHQLVIDDAQLTRQAQQHELISRGDRMNPT